MVVVYEISGDANGNPIRRKGKKNNAKNEHTYMQVKWVNSNLKEKTDYCRSTAKGKVLSKMWGGIDSDGTPLADSIEHAKILQKEFNADKKKTRQRGEAAALSSNTKGGRVKYSARKGAKGAKKFAGSANKEYTKALNA